MQHDLPEHVRRIVDRDGEAEFVPPSFERWLGRLQMMRTIVSMTAFMLVWMISHEAGQDWAGATVRALVAGVVFHFFAWAAGLLIFGEMYEAEVKQAKIDLEVREKSRARRIEEYYRERLRAQGMIMGNEKVEILSGGSVPALDPSIPAPVAANAMSSMMNSSQYESDLTQQRAA